MITIQCQIKCTHCIVRHGHFTRPATSLSAILEWIEQISAYDQGAIKLLYLTGGEPFYDIENLRTIASYAENRGLSVSVITNGMLGKKSASGPQHFTAAPVHTNDRDKHGCLSSGSHTVKNHF